MNVIIILAALAAAFLVVAFSDNREHQSSTASMRAFYIAEAGLNDAIARFRACGEGTIGTPQTPILFGGGSYYVTADTGEGPVTLVAVGRYGDSVRAIEGVVSLGLEGVSTFTAYGDTSIVMAGENVVDSFDSSAGAYLSHPRSTTAQGTSYAGRLADVVSGGTIDILDPRSVVAGDVSARGIGDLNAAGVILGTTIPGRGDQPFPPIRRPDTSSWSPKTPIRLQNTASNTLPPGKYFVSEFSVSDDAVLTLTGPATYVVDTWKVQSNGKVLIDGTAGPVLVYVEHEFEMQSDGSVSSTRSQAADLCFFVSIDNHTGCESDPKGNSNRKLALEGMARMNGSLYAPNGVMNLLGDSQVFGSVTAKRIYMDGKSQIHFDEGLRQAPWISSGRGVANTWGQLQGRGGDPGGGSGGERSPRPGHGPSLLSWREVHADRSPQGRGPVGGAPSPNDRGERR